MIKNRNLGELEGSSSSISMANNKIYAKIGKLIKIIVRDKN